MNARDIIDSSTSGSPISAGTVDQNPVEASLAARSTYGRDDFYRDVGIDPTAVSANTLGKRSRSTYQGMPNSADYYISNTDYQANALERFGDWFTGRDRNADYQSAQQYAQMQYQDAYNKWLAQREDSQIQRMVSDLKKAGLNPWLAVQNGFTGSNTEAVSPVKTSAVKIDKKTGIGDIFMALLTTALKVATVGLAAEKVATLAKH